jgi:hypothetical protein
MESAAHIEARPLSPVVRDQPGDERRAPVKVVGKRGEHDWLRTAWTAVFVAYAGAVVPLVGWAIAHAL